MIGSPPLVPRSFEIPLRVETDRFVLVPLSAKLFPLDFDAYMTSVEHLQQTFDVDVDPLHLGGEHWPAGSDIEFALVDAAWCQFEWQHLRSSFTYVPLSPDESRSLGAGYIMPCKKPGFDIECQTWVRADEAARGFDEEFYEWFRGWVDEAWPFAGLQIGCPGREIPWDEWNAVPDDSVAAKIERAVRQQ
jgi:hypothetical protein